jgi:hypothetical protein
MKAEKQAGCVYLRVRRPGSCPTVAGKYLLTERDLHLLGGHAGQNSRISQQSSTLGALAAHQMARAGHLAPDLAPSRNFDSLAQALMGLLLWHLHGSFKVVYAEHFKKTKRAEYLNWFLLSTAHLAEFSKKPKKSGRSNCTCRPAQKSGDTSQSGPSRPRMKKKPPLTAGCRHNWNTQAGIFTTACTNPLIQTASCPL